MPPPRRRTFYETITAAVDDVARHGFDSAERVAHWIAEIRRAAAADMIPEHQMEEGLRAAMRQVYARLVERGGIYRLHPGVSRFTVERLLPRMRSELDRRIMASAGLIRLNRAEAIERTVRRFSGWATSVPVGGTRAPGQRAEAKGDVRKALASLPFEERRVLIDQGHKLTAAINEVVATGSGALAAVWHSHWRQAGYDYREDHRERDGKVYALRPNWALEAGLMKAGPDGYADGVTKPGEEVFCRCYHSFLYNLRDLPDAMLTAKGRASLKTVRVA